MIEHHLQKQIIATLVECESARYSDIKPANVDGNTFTYHLKALITADLITKNDDGSYALTNKGKLQGINSSLTKQEFLTQPHAIILLAVRRGDEWLLRKRLVQPLYGKIGFIHGEPKLGETVLASANRILKKRTGLTGNYRVKGFGYITLQSGGEVVSFTNYTLVEVSEVEGELAQSDSHGENMWLTTPDFRISDMIPSMQDLVAKLAEPGLFFSEKIYIVA